MYNLLGFMITLSEELKSKGKIKGTEKSFFILTETVITWSRARGYSCVCVCCVFLRPINFYLINYSLVW